MPSSSHPNGARYPSGLLEALEGRLCPVIHHATPVDPRRVRKARVQRLDELRAVPMTALIASGRVEVDVDSAPRVREDVVVKEADTFSVEEIGSAAWSGRNTRFWHKPRSVPHDALRCSTREVAFPRIGRRDTLDMEREALNGLPVVRSVVEWRGVLGQMRGDRTTPFGALADHKSPRSREADEGERGQDAVHPG